MIFKVRYETLGGHTHCTLFCAKQQNMTWANCGTFVIDAHDLEDVQLAMSGIHFAEREHRGD